MKFWCLAIGVSLIGGEVSATTALSRSLEELSESPIVITGRVERVETVTLKKQLETLYRIRVQERIKGNVPTEISVLVPGGKAKGLEVRVAGVARMKPGEEVILFLDRSPVNPKYYEVQEYAQGKFSIIKDGAGNRVVVGDTTDLNLVERPAPRKAIQYSPPGRSRSRASHGVISATNYDEFRRKLDAAMRRSP